MRIDLLIFGLIALILGIVISGIVGNILLIVGILILLYAFFSRDKSSEEIREIPQNNAANNKKVIKSPQQHYEERITSKDRNRIEKPPERRVKVIDIDDSNKCPECGSTNNPENARFCADCGKKLHK